jgi:hypothetical protein
MARRTALERALEWLSEHSDTPAPRAFARSARKDRRRPGAGGRHGRKCKVCRHPDRDAIERDFLRWHSPDRIAEDYGIAITPPCTAMPKPPDFSIAAPPPFVWLSSPSSSEP